MTKQRLIGVDIGGSGVKAALVDLRAGRILSRRSYLPTPIPSTPRAIARTVASLIGTLDYPGQIGIAVPCVLQDGVAKSAANIDPSWVNTNAVKLFESTIRNRQIALLNDADAAGLAESRYGMAAGNRGTVLILTFGTGIGSAILRNGILVPNTELGHLLVDGEVAESLAAASVRKAEKLSWRKWAQRANRFLETVETVLRPDLVVIGGGISAKAHKWEHLLVARAPVVPAALRNDAGIIGTALHAEMGAKS